VKNNNLLSITEASEKVKVSRDKIRYWAKLLNIEIIKKGRVSYIPETSNRLLLEVKKSVAAGLSPSLSAKEVLTTYAEPEQTKEIEVSVESTNNRIESLERAIMLLAESNNRLTEDNKVLRSQNETILEMVSKQARQLNKLTLNRSEPSKHKPVEVWQPPVKKVTNYSFITRFVLELFDPIKLRG